MREDVAIGREDDSGAEPAIVIIAPVWGITLGGISYVYLDEIHIITPLPLRVVQRVGRSQRLRVLGGFRLWPRSRRQHVRTH